MQNNLKVYHYLLIHTFIIISVFLLMYLIGIIKILPKETNIIQWDAGWYLSIVENGYNFKQNSQSNTGFFPLFPYIWKTLNLSNIGISIFNFIMFLIGLLFISKSINKLQDKIILLCLSFPSLFFMYVPYSEALFFLTSSIYMYGNHKNNTYIKILAIFISSLARPTIFFFLPAILFSELLFSDKINKKIKSIIIYSITIIIGTFCSFYIIGYSSNNIFAYSDSQINNWEHNFSIPKLPLTTWRGYRILWLDLFALWITLASTIGTLIYFIKTIKGNKYNKNLLLSIFYLFMILIYVLFFHPKEETSGFTSILSLNRYVFCSPFIFYLIIYFYNNKTKKLIQILILSLSISILLIGFPFKELIGLNYIKTILFIIIFSLFITIQLLPFLIKKTNILFIPYTINIILQCYIFQSFLKENWIG